MSSTPHAHRRAAVGSGSLSGAFKTQAIAIAFARYQSCWLWPLESNAHDDHVIGLFVFAFPIFECGFDELALHGHGLFVDGL